MQAEQELPATPEMPDAGYPWKPGNTMLRNYEQNLRDPVAADPLLEASEAQEIAEAAMAAEEGAENATVEPLAEDVPDTDVGEIKAQAAEASVENMEETTSIPDDSGAEVEPEALGRTIEEVAGEYGNQAKAVSDLYREGQDVEGFASAVRAAWEMGGSGIPMERVNSSPRTQGITQEQRRTAYLLGQGAARLAAQSQTAANAKKATGGTVRRKGLVKAQGGITIDELAKTFNDPQRSAYKLLSFYAETTGIDVVLYKGTQEQETGRFAHGEDTIYIDITAGTNGWDTTDLGAYTMMRTYICVEYVKVRGYCLPDYASLVQRFADVDPDAWYADEIAKAAALGIVQGAGGGMFEPDRAVTRAEAAAMCVRLYEILKK